MRQRIVVELEGEEPPLEEISNMVRETVIWTVLKYRMSEIRDFSICREFLPEEVDGEIQVPEFVNRDEVIKQLWGGNEHSAPGEEAVQDG